MGYCSEHDKVYNGPECPECAGDEAEVMDAAGGQNDKQSEQEPSTELDRGNSIGDEIERAVQESVDDISIETDNGDIVAGDQEKSVDKSTQIDIDRSTHEVDESEEVHDERTVVEDAVVKDADIGTDASATVKDDVVRESQRSPESSESERTRSGSSRQADEPHGERSPTSPDNQWRPKTREGESPDRQCPSCGATVSEEDAFCMNCGTQL